MLVKIPMPKGRGYVGGSLHITATYQGFRGLVGLRQEELHNLLSLPSDLSRQSSMSAINARRSHCYCSSNNWYASWFEYTSQPQRPGGLLHNVPAAH